MKGSEPRMSGPTLRVLAAVMMSPWDELSGADVGREAKLASGTLYPILARLEHAHWLESRWEDGDPHLLGRPRRRLYRLTALGAAKAGAAFQELEPVVRRLAWS
jgi:PadR family transcriptional regulator, regulatory protein PadR